MNTAETCVLIKGLVAAVRQHNTSPELDEKTMELMAAAEQEIERLESGGAAEYVVWGPDGIPIHQETLHEVEDAVQFAAAFVSRYAEKGYYFDSRQQRIPVTELFKKLSVETVGKPMTLTQAYTKYITENYERFAEGWTPISLEEFKTSEECENYMDDEIPLEPDEGKDTEWHKLGVAGVDAGMLMIHDPCYISSEWKGDGEETPKTAPAYRHEATGKILYCVLHGAAPAAGAIGFSNYEQQLPEFGGMTPNQMNAAGDMKKLKGGDPSGEFSYSGCCEATDTPEMGGQLNYKRGHEGAGVVFNTGVGDGVYPVFVRYVDLDGWGRRVAEMRCVFIEQGAEKETEEFVEQVVNRIKEEQEA